MEPAGNALAAGDQVVIAGQAGLKPGSQVRMAGEKEPVEKAVEKAGGRAERAE
jgi:hypothetical protein